MVKNDDKYQCHLLFQKIWYSPFILGHIIETFAPFSIKVLASCQTLLSKGTG
ncbi:MAG: hypothetical protein WDM90_18460 [Ferruginibacter sp.]